MPSCSLLQLVYSSSFRRGTTKVSPSIYIENYYGEFFRPGGRRFLLSRPQNARHKILEGCRILLRQCVLLSIESPSIYVLAAQGPCGHSASFFHYGRICDMANCSERRPILVIPIGLSLKFSS